MVSSGIQLKKAIMRRVYLAYAVRRVFHALTLKTAGIVLFAWGIFLQVSIGNVIANARQAADASYFAYAFAQTEFIVQAFMVGVIILSIWLAHDIYRTWKGAHTEAAGLVRF